MTMAAAVMEQRRLGLIAKAMLVVPAIASHRPPASFWPSIRARAHSRRRRDEFHRG